MRNSTAIPLSSEPNDPDPDTPSVGKSGDARARLGGWIARFWLLPVGVMLVLPVLAVLAAALQWNAESADIVREMALTVLPEYAWTSLLLCVLVAAGTLFLGLGSASLVTLFDFRGRRQWEWLLLLPLAMPAYVSAYAYTDFLQFSGPAQTWLREALQAEGRMLPEVRTVWGAAFLFIVTLYPYVYLLARTALLERATHLMEAAAMLGTGLRTRILRVALPLVRPSVAAGVALALMEVLADFGVSSYFGIQTFTAGIIKAWVVMDDHIAATQLALVLLATVALLLWLERRARRRMRFASSRGQRQGGTQGRVPVLQGGRAMVAHLLCAVPVVLGFAAPVLMMLRPLLQGLELDQEVMWAQFLPWAWNSIRLGLSAAVLATLLALALAGSARLFPGRMTGGLMQLASLGYAVPGAVIVVGLLLPVAALQSWQPEWTIGGLVTTTVLGVLWAYLVRFTAVALQSVQGGYARIPASQDESGRLLGIGGWRLLGQVHLPLLRGPVLAGLLLVFVDVMKELPATMVLRPFNMDTLAVSAFQLARDERLTEAALPSLALVLAGLVPVILLSRSLRRRNG